MKDANNALPDGTEEHAEYNPSSMSMFEKCPGFRNRKNSNKAAERGTRIHAALQKGDLDSLEDEDEKHLARKIQDFVDGIIAENRPSIPTEFKEQRLEMDLGGGLVTFGTGDLLLFYGKKGIFVDYKTGELEVADAEENPQGWCYTIGAFQKYTELDELTFWFLIPQRDQASYHVFKRSDLPAMKFRINTIVRKAMEVGKMRDDGDPKHEEFLNPQPELCEYCAFQGTCKALGRKALAVASKLAPGLPIPQSVTVDAGKPEDIPHLLRLAPLLESWASGIREDALRVNLEDGIDIDGFIRQKRAIPRSVNSVYGTWKVLKEKGISLDEFLDACGKVSIPQLEKLVTGRAERGKKGKAWQDVEDELRGEDILRSGGEIFYLREDKKKLTNE